MRHPHILFSLLLGASTVHGASPSFDCTRAAHPVEKQICASQPLSALDAKLAQAYTRLRHRVRGASDPAIARALIREQKKWLTRRNHCRDSACLLRQYHTRQKRLEDWTYIRHEGHDPFAGVYYRFALDYGELVLHSLGQGRYSYHYFLTLSNQSMTHATDDGNATLDPSRPNTLLAEGTTITCDGNVVTLYGEMLGFFDGFTFKEILQKDIS